MSNATLWLLDEPVTNLDSVGRDYVEDRLREHIAGGGLAIAATHEDIRLASESPDEIFLGDDA